MMTKDEITQIVKKIEAYNNCWHSMKEAIAEEKKQDSTEEQVSNLLENSLKELRDIKGLLQVQLLRESDGLAYLKIDTDSKWIAEDCFTVVLNEKIAGRKDACHLPVRIAKKLMLPSEIEHFSKGEWNE